MSWRAGDWANFSISCFVAKEKFPELQFDFTFYDLKAKGVSDLSGTL